MTEAEFNERLRQHFDQMNSVGLGELILFGSGIDRFVENENRRERLLKAVVDICGGYQVNAREFVKLISYEDFKKRHGISEIMALGLKIYLIFYCGVDWNNPENIVRGF